MPHPLFIAISIAATVVITVLLIVGFLVPYLRKLDSKAIFKPHVYRNEYGTFYVRAYRLFGRKYLARTHNFNGAWSFYFSKHISDAWRFTTLEDASQGWEAFTDQLVERLEREAEQKREKLARKKAAGVVHRFQ